MPDEYLDLVMEALRRGRLRFGRNNATGDGVLALIVEDEDGEDHRLVPVARLVACPPTELPSAMETAEA